MDPRLPSPEEQHLKAEHVRQILAGLKTVADFTTNPQGRGAIVQRLSSVAAAKGIAHLEHVQEAAKEAAVAYAAWEPLALATLIEHKLGPDWITYEPETIMEALPLDVDQTAQALCARQVLYDRAPFTEWHVFEKIAVAFNGRTPDFETTQDLSPPELAWAVHHMQRIDASTPFSEEVRNYIATLLRDAGCVLCARALVDCQPNLDRILSDHGHEVQHACNTLPADSSEAVAQQWHLKSLCDDYVTVKDSKLTKELTQL